MIYDDKTIYIHEIDMLNRFLMVPCFENHQFYEFLSFYFKKIKKAEELPLENTSKWTKKRIFEKTNIET